MKATNQLETTDYTEYTDKNTKSCRDTERRVLRPKSKTARRKQFMREYRKLYKETKRFVIETIQQYLQQAATNFDKGKGIGETDPLTSLIKYALQKAISTPNGSGIISASRQSHLLEIVEGILARLKSDNNKTDISEWKKRPYHRLTFDNGFKIYFRPACFKGESYRGIHVDTFSIMYEVESERNKDIATWKEFCRTMKPGCEARVFCGSSQRAQRKI